MKTAVCRFKLTGQSQAQALDGRQRLRDEARHLRRPAPPEIRAGKYRNAAEGYAEGRHLHLHQRRQGPQRHPGDHRSTTCVYAVDAALGRNPTSSPRCNQTLGGLVTEELLDRRRRLHRPRRPRRRRRGHHPRSRSSSPDAGGASHGQRHARRTAIEDWFQSHFSHLTPGTAGPLHRHAGEGGPARRGSRRRGRRRTPNPSPTLNPH